MNTCFIFNYDYILIDSTPVELEDEVLEDEVLEDDVFMPASKKRPSEIEGDTSNIIPPSTRPRFMDSDVPDESRFMPPPIARSSMSKPTKSKPSKPPTAKPPKSKPQIPKTTRKTRSQTANLLLLLEMSLYPLMTQYQMTHCQLWSKSPETYLIYRKIF